MMLLIKPEDTMTLINNYVDQLTIDLDKDKLKQMIKETFIDNTR